MTKITITLDVVAEIAEWAASVSGDTITPSAFCAKTDSSTTPWYAEPTRVAQLRGSTHYGAQGRDLLWCAVAFYGEAGLEFAARAGLGLDALPDRIAELIDLVTTRGSANASSKPRAKARQFAKDGERYGARMHGEYSTLRLVS